MKGEITISEKEIKEMVSDKLKPILEPLDAHVVSVDTRYGSMTVHFTDEPEESDAPTS